MFGDEHFKILIRTINSHNSNTLKQCNNFLKDVPGQIKILNATLKINYKVIFLLVESKNMQHKNNIKISNNLLLLFLR